MCEYIVTVAQETGHIKVEFSAQGDALRFAEVCLECGVGETVVTLRKNEED